MFYDILDKKSIKDIGCMKLSAIISRATNKDYIDLYYILQRVELLELLKWAEQKFPEIDTNLILKSLVYFEDVEVETINFKHNKEVDFEPDSTKKILSHAQEEPIKEFTKELGKINARAVSNLIVAYNPSLITFGGAVTLNHPDVFLKPIKENIDQFLNKPEIKVTPLGEDIILMGAAASYFFPVK